MKHYAFIKKIWILFIIIIILFTVIFAAKKYSEYTYKRNFVNNRKNEPYFLNIPLDEMNFNVYAGYFSQNQTLIDPNYTKSISLPCDLDYYAQKDDAEPALTFQKGTTVYVLPSDTAAFPTIGYGLQCWPDYQSGWRYGHPFLTADISYDPDTYPMYYVKTAQLKKVAQAFYKANTKQLTNYYLFSSEFADKTVGYIDQVLYENGVFCVDTKKDIDILSDDARVRAEELDKIAFLLDDLKETDKHFTCTMKIQNNSKYDLQSCDIRYGYFLYTEEGWAYDVTADASKARFFALKSGETKEFQVNIPMQIYKFFNTDHTEYIDVKLRGYLESEAAENAFNVWLEILPDGFFHSMSNHSTDEKSIVMMNSPCWVDLSFEDAVNNAATIVHGRVLSKRNTLVHKTAALRLDLPGDYSREVTVEVIETIKGEVDSTIVYLELGRETNISNYVFREIDVVEPDDEYIFFLNEYGTLSPAELVPVSDGYVLTKGRVAPEASGDQQGETMILEEYIDAIKSQLLRE